MPSILIEVRRKYNAAQEVAIMDAVHQAVREAFKLQAHDKTVRLIAHEPHRFMCPPHTDKPDRYTHISIDAFAGRSVAAKRHLYQAIVTGLEPLGIPKDHVTILLRELSKENWGIRGGQAGCDVVQESPVDV